MKISKHSLTNAVHTMLPVVVVLGTGKWLEGSIYCLQIVHFVAQVVWFYVKNLINIIHILKILSIFLLVHLNK